jgi:hypothetical protein
MRNLRPFSLANRLIRRLAKDREDNNETRDGNHYFQARFQPAHVRSCLTGPTWLNFHNCFPASTMYYYTALERFDHNNGDRWVDYTRWLGRNDLIRIVSLDSILCSPVVHTESSEDWQFVAKEEFMLDFFTDLNFVLQRVAGHRPFMVLAVARDPSEADVNGFSQPNFEFAGFDIVDTQFIASALLNNSRFQGVFDVGELSQESGLILSWERAFQIRDILRERYPDCDGAKCHVWAIWRYTGIVDDSV